MALVGPDAEHYDKRFTWLINGTAPEGAAVRRLPLGGRAVLVRATGNYLIWSDIPNNRMLRWVPDGSPAASASSAPTPTTRTATPATARGGS